ncbi:[NiFe]-hydrogenase assembly chaperone HybE (plasmid) [Cupriavidus necator]|uniref:[NiFe]-hydrogenase assembly chaperone HybE n=1 Tax=Cupriavidus necator TaxID=106590 RepID=UPI003F740184
MTPVQHRDTLVRRVATLERAFRMIEQTRMHGVPMLHPGLRVEAVGFEPVHDPDGGAAALGALVTPWLMNLIWLRLDDGPGLPAGRARARMLGAELLEFTGAVEGTCGAYETCSLFSPMFEFPDHAAARATALEVLKVLRAPASNPARRAFLTGRVRSSA